MFFSKFIDHYALHDLHKTRSQDSQFTSIPANLPEIKERETFYQSEKADVSLHFRHSEKAYDVGTFRYRSLIKTGDPINDILEGEFYLHKNHMDSPHFIFVHGWRMESTDRVKKMFHKPVMNKFGGNMYYFPLPYHFQRKPESSTYSGEYMISSNIHRTIQSTQQAIVDLRALIHWIKKSFKSPVILIGVSLGGFLTNLMVTLESEIDVLVSIFYANRLSYSIWNTIPGKYIKADLEGHGVTYEDLIGYWQITEPNQGIPKMKKENILLISAKYDQYVPIEDTDYLWESWGRPTRYVYSCGHAGIVLNRKRIAKDTLDFVQERIGVDGLKIKH